jgi:uncharacterized protein (TIGR00255 family)
MLSMTGFGVGEAPLGDGRLTLELRALNHRFLEVRVRLPNELVEHAFFLEQLARARLSRGRFEVGVRISGSTLPVPKFSLERGRALYEGLKALADEVAPGSELPVTVLAPLSHLLLDPASTDADTARQALTLAFSTAKVHLDEMRAREGKALEADLRARLAELRRLNAEVMARSPEVVEASRARLRERLERLLGGTSGLDEQRLEAEVALLADRADVAEEVARLASHFSQFELLLESQEPVGRRLEFLLQEMAREANTIGSKSQDAKLAHLVVSMKAEVERIREQVQNVE